MPANSIRLLWCTLRACSTAIGMAYLAVTSSPFIVDRWCAALSVAWLPPPESPEMLFVLGAGILDDGTVGESSYWRAVYSKLAWQEQRFRRIIYSGASVSISMREFAVALGVPRDITDVENASTSTLENASELRKLAGDNPTGLVLLTSDYHMYRAIRVFRRAGLNAGTLPIPDAAKRAGTWQTRWPAFTDLLVETVKIVYYKAHGWIYAIGTIKRNP